MASLGSQEYLTSTIPEVWGGLLRRAVEAKKDFDIKGAQIREFYGGKSGFMWSGNYMDRFMGGSSGITPPKFKITISKAFEFVALIGPMLFWQMADRKVRPYKSMQLDMSSMFGNDPMMQQALQMMTGEQASDDARNEMRSRVLEHILNYFQREQYGGGIGPHIDLSLFEALTLGAGFMKTEHYNFPMSDRTLVGSFHVPTDDVLVDPDCKDPLWTKARWIAIRHQNQFWEVEEHFNLPPGSLRSYGSRTSAGASWQSGRTDLPATKQYDPSRDLIEWYEIFSRAGVGNKLTGTMQNIAPEFDAALKGGCAYLCIAKNCPFPLNLPSGELAKNPQNEGDPGSVEWVREQLRWPTEYWLDNKWPVTKLAFYPHSGKSLWPEPPLAPAIGELTILNILVSAYVQAAYDNRQQVIGVKKNMVEDIQGLLTSNKSPLVVEMDFDGGITRSVNDVIQFMNRPEVNQDVPKTIEFLLGLIERRTGMSDMLYGHNSGSNPRSAAEYEGKRDSVNIRPDYMQKCVADMQSEVADKEVFCAWSHVGSDDIAEQLGPLGVKAYDELVTNEQPEAILRGSKCWVEASSMARPNKARDAAMLNQIQPTLMPVLAGHLAQHNDPKPLNGFIKALGDASEIEVDQFLIPEPAPDDQAIAMQQQMQQAELAEVQAKANKLNADAQSVQATGQNAAYEAQMKAQESEHAMSLKEQEAALKAQAAEHAMQINQAETEVKVAGMDMANRSKAESAAQQMAIKQRQFEFEQENKAGAAVMNRDQQMQQARQKLALEILGGHQKMNQAEETHQQALTHADEKAEQDAQHANMINANRMMMSSLNKSGG